MKNLLLVILVQIFFIQKCFKAAAISCHPIQIQGENWNSLFCLDDDGNGCENDDDGCVGTKNCAEYNGYQYYVKNYYQDKFINTLPAREKINSLKDGQTDPCEVDEKKRTINDSKRRILV